MKYKGMGARVLAVLMAVTTLLGVMASPAGAVSHGIHTQDTSKRSNTNSTPEEWNYVSLGDSMSNGFGLDGYDGCGYLEVAPASYPALFAQWLAGGAGSIAAGQTEYSGDKGTVHLTQLATSAMRIQDLYFILTHGTEAAFPGDEWTRIQLLGGDRVTADGTTVAGESRWGSDGEVWSSTVATYQNAVMEADIITLAVGNGDYGRYLFDILLQEMDMPGISTGEDYSYATLENALKLHGLDPKMREAVIDLYSAAQVYMQDLLPMAQADVFADRMAYVTANFLVCYNGVLDRIVQLNPDVEIVVLPLMNTVSSEEDRTLKGELTLGKLIHLLYGYLNQYMAILPAYKLETDPDAYGSTSIYYAEADAVDCIADEMAQRLAHPASDLRARLMHSLIGTKDAPGMIWGLLENTTLVEGFSLVYVSEKQILEYMGYTDFERALYAVEYPEEAVSIAVYLAFEKALAEIGNAGTAPLKTFAALGDAGGDLFGGVIRDFMDRIPEAGAPYKATVAEVVAGVANALQSELVFDVDDVLTIMERNAKSEAYIQEVAFLQATARISVELGTSVSVEIVRDLYRNDAEYAGVITKAVDEGKAIVSEMLYETYDLDGKVDMMCMLLALPEALSASLMNDEITAGLMSLLARCVVAEGIAGHPSEAGHKKLAESIQKAHTEGFTVRDAADLSLYGSYTVTDSSYYVALTGSSSAYAGMLADALHLDRDTQFHHMTWNALDLDELAKADLITVGYDESRMSSFAMDQMLAYIAAYIDTDLRDSVSSYVYRALSRVLEEDQASNFSDSVNGYLDELLAHELLAGKTKQPMDWVTLAGEDGAVAVSEALARLRAELIAAGIPDVYVYTIDVVPYLHDFTRFKESRLYEWLGDDAYFHVEIPVADVLLYTLESYLFETVSFQKLYAETMAVILLRNPGATTVLLGQYNPFAGVVLSLGETEVSVEELYVSLVSTLSGVPDLLARLGANVSYAHIPDAETHYMKARADGQEGYSWIDILADPTLTGLTEDGHAYVVRQILSSVKTSCGHSYDDCLDTLCHRCGETREAPGHTEGHATCTEDYACLRCGTVLETAKGHTEVIDEAVAPTCTALGKTEGKHCSVCGITLVRREPVAATGHTWVTDEAVEPDCITDGKTSGKHCSTCGKVFVPQETVTAPGHDWSNATCHSPKTCTVCGETEGEALGHAYDNACDTDCNACGESRTPADHTFGDWAVTVAPTPEAEGTEERVCSACGHTETRTVARTEPEITIPPETETEPSTEAETQTPGGQNGCGSALGVGMALWIAVGVAAAVLKKKED